MKRGLLFAAIATITGTAIGAGFLGIPYVAAKSGFAVALIHLIVLALIVMLINLYLGEIILRTKERHQLPGYAARYLGGWARVLMFAAMMFGIYTAIIAYLLGEGQVLSSIFTGSLQYALLFSIGFFIVIAALAYLGIEALKKSESGGLIIVMALVLLISIVFGLKMNPSNLSFVSKNPVMWFFPYGVVLFSFLSFSALPEVGIELKNNKGLMKKAIIIGATIPVVAYILFTTVVVGFAGQATPEIATLALGKLAGILAAFTMFTASLVLSNAMRDAYKFDLKMKHFWAWMLACIVPFIILILMAYYKLATFIGILELSGAISGGLTGILIVLMIIRAKKLGNRKPEYKIPINWFIAALLIALFVFGIAYQFLF
jgi:tyrosine-specific transport protein